MISISLKIFVVLLSICVIKVSSDQNFGKSDVDIQEHNPVLKRRQVFTDDSRMRSPATADDLAKYTKSKEEMEFTKLSPVIDPQPCSDVHPIAVFIHSAAHISGKYFWRRVITRVTWASDMKRLNISVYFVIALNRKSTVNEELKKESDLHKDIIQFSFIDAYHNLTLKAVSILQWIERKCKTAKYIIKADDDALVDSTRLVNSLHNITEDGFYGKEEVGALVNRDENQKWYLPEKYYPNDTYPKYTSGPFYVMVGNLSYRLLKAIDEYTDHVITIDDVFITGIIRQKAGIKTHSDRYDLCSDEPKPECVFCKSAARAQCVVPIQRMDIWDAFKSSNESRQTVNIVVKMPQSIPPSTSKSDTTEPFTSSTLSLVSSTNYCPFESNFWFLIAVIIIGLVVFVAIVLAVIALIVFLRKRVKSSEDPGL